MQKNSSSAFFFWVILLKCFILFQSDFQQSDSFTRFQSSYAPYQTGTHFTAYSSSLSCEKRERKKKYLLLALAVGLTPHNYFTAVKHECTEWFLNPNMSHYFLQPMIFCNSIFFIEQQRKFLDWLFNSIFNNSNKFVLT